MSIPHADFFSNLLVVFSDGREQNERVRCGELGRVLRRGHEAREFLEPAKLRMTAETWWRRCGQNLKRRLTLTTNARFVSSGKLRASVSRCGPEPIQWTV